MRFDSLRIFPGLVAMALALAACDSGPAVQAGAVAVGFTCAPRGGGAAELPDEWGPFADDIDECSLRGPDGAVALRERKRPRMAT
jgi:hypothetical protein